MKLLFDENLSFKLCERLDSLFPGSSQARLVGLAEANDRAIWDYAGANGFTLVSLDADFADWANVDWSTAEGDLASLRQPTDGQYRKTLARSF
jgi:predicted nuclease of predicted toxin-antitoxin system